MANSKMATSSSKKVRLPFSKTDLWDVVRVVLGILILCILMSISMDMVNEKFAPKRSEIIELEDDKGEYKELGWAVMTAGYVVPLALVCVIPVLACIGSKKGEKRKHLIKLLILVGAGIIVLGIIAPKQIQELYDQRNVCRALEQKADEDKDFVYPADQPTLEDATLDLDRQIKWGANALLAFAVVGAYQGIRYKRWREGDLDDEVPEDEVLDDLPDVDWTPGKRESKNS